MRSLRLSVFLFLIPLSLTFAQNAKDWSKKSITFSNPSVVYTPGDNFGYFEESFEDTTFPPAGWTKLSPDGGTGWTRVEAGTTPIPGWLGGEVTTPPGGGQAVAFCTWNTGGATSNDQYLVTPQIQNVQSGDSIVFWVQVPGYTLGYAENLDILISTTGTAVGDFNVIVDTLRWSETSVDSLWTRYAYNLTDYVPAGSDIYVAFREWVSDNFNEGAAVLLDLVSASMFIPVELVSFNASVSGNEVVLTWLTASETNNRGFEVQRKSDGEYQTISFVEGFGTTTNSQSYSYTDKNLQPGSYTYKLKQIDLDGTFEYSNEVEVDFAVPSEFSLMQNYPNPFNPVTRISFTLPVESRLILKVYNLLGEEVRTLIDDMINEGYHNIDFDASTLNSGIYFYQIEALGIDGSVFSEVKKMILTK